MKRHQDKSFEVAEIDAITGSVFKTGPLSAFTHSISGEIRPGCMMMFSPKINCHRNNSDLITSITPAFLYAEMCIYQN